MLSIFQWSWGEAIGRLRVGSKCGDGRRGERKWGTHLRAWGRLLPTWSQQLPCALPLVVAQVKAWRESGAFWSGAFPETQESWGYLFITRGHSTCSGQGLICLPTFIYLTSPSHLVPHKTGHNHSNLQNILSWPHSHTPFQLLLCSCLFFPARFLERFIYTWGLHFFTSRHSTHCKPDSASTRNLYGLMKVTSGYLGTLFSVTLLNISGGFGT